VKKILIMLFLAALAVSAIDYTSITVVNNTDVSINALIGSKWVLDIPPGGKSGAVAVDKGDVRCQAVVSPGEPHAGQVVQDTVLSITEGDPVPFNCEDVTGGYTWNTDSLKIKGQ